jgi:hypothetical protein
MARDLFLSSSLVSFLIRAILSFVLAWAVGAPLNAQEEPPKEEEPKATGNPATPYVHPKTGQSVVLDDVTGEVIHVGGPGFTYGPRSGDVP